MKKMDLLSLTAVLLIGCGQNGALVLPSGQPPTPGSAGQVGEPTEDDKEKKAKPDGG